MRSRLPSFGDVFDLRVTLRHIEPAISRTLRVPAHETLAVLHEVLQTAFGWKNSHLHDFRVGDIRFGMTGVEDDLFLVDERAAPLGAVVRVGSTFTYLYDFGDDWEHEIAVEGVTHDRGSTVLCRDGARACPPEDCGGPPGYADLLEALANPKHEEHADMKRWAPRGFDPTKFDAAAVNRKLAALSKRLTRWRT